MFNDELVLITYGILEDSVGNKKKSEIRRKALLCEVRSTTRMEYYNHATADRRPEYVVTINSCEYEGEVDCEFRGRKYKISRIYENTDADRDMIELTLERQMGI